MSHNSKFNIKVNSSYLFGFFENVVNEEREVNRSHSSDRAYISILLFIRFNDGIEQHSHKVSVLFDIIES